jgi:hypothetical protein
MTAFTDLPTAEGPSSVSGVPELPEAPYREAAVAYA